MHSNAGETLYKELTHGISEAGFAMARLVGSLPVALPEGGNSHNGGANANDIIVSKILETLGRFVVEIELELAEVRLWNAEHWTKKKIDKQQP